MILAVEDLQAPAVVDQDVGEGLRWGHVVGLAAEQPSSERRETRCQDSAGRGEGVGKAGVGGLLPIGADFAALAFVGLDVLQSKAAEPGAVEQGPRLVGAAIAVDELHELIGRISCCRGAEENEMSDAVSSRICTQKE